MRNVFTIGLFLLQVLPHAIVAQIPTNGLVAFYPFDGNANDESGSGNNGIIYGAALTSDRCGIDNKAFYFDGNDDYITVPHNFDLSEVTICGWIKPDMIPQEGAVIFKSSEYFEDTWGLYLRNDLHILEDIDDHNLQIYHTVINSNWHFFSAVLTNHLENKLYVDGILVGSGLLSLDSWASYEGNLFIGQRGTSAWNGFFAGKIDDIRIYNRELSQDEVMRLFIYDCPEAQINGNPEVCQGQENVQYSANFIENGEYTWDYSGSGVTIAGNSNIVTLDFDNQSSGGNLSVTISVNDIPIQTKTVAISVNPLPGDAGVIKGENSVCSDQDVTYSVLPISNATSYLWSFNGTGASLIGNSDSIMASFSENATGGNLSVQGVNSCGYGETSTLRISLIPCDSNSYVLDIPNAFSPNGDGINESFVITGLTPGSKLQIFNQNGNQIFISENYRNDWDGKDNDGHMLKTGTYWYVLTVKGIPKEFKGFVYLKK